MRAALVTVVTAVACGLVACSEGPTSDPPAALELGACGDTVDLTALTGPRADRLTFACGVLEVPLDHDDADSEPIPMAVVRIRDAAQHDRIGSLVMNPGGPGQSGLTHAAYWAGWLPDDILERFDIVTFDPRGTGLSAGINCGSLPEDEQPGVLLDIGTTDGFAQAERLARDQAEACAAEVGEDRVGFFNTTATARDLDLLREALGDDRLSYLGFSYGAKLGGAYAHQFPDRVRALVLDAPSDPLEDWLIVTRRQVAGFEDSFAAYADDCPHRPTCASLGDAREALASLVAKADGFPVPSGRPQDDVPMSGSDVLYAITGLLYSTRLWPNLDQAIGEALLGDSGGLHDAVDHTHERATDDESADGDDALYVINCNDAVPGPGSEEIMAAARDLTEKYPTFGAVGSWWLLGCTFWDQERAVLEEPVAPDAPPLLVVGTRHDPATPYRGAVAFAETLGSGHLLTWEGQGHTAYGQSECVTELADAYLIDLTVPEEGTRCLA